MEKIKNPKKVIAKLLENNTPFRSERTTYTEKLTFLGEEKHFLAKTKKPLALSSLSLIKQVKKFANELIVNGVFQDSLEVPENISYIHFNYSKLKKFEGEVNLLEIDLNAIYWNIFYETFNLPEIIYKKGLELEKVARLIALGNLAKNTRIINYRNCKFDYDVKEEPTAFLFYYCAYRTSLIMQDLQKIAGKEYFFRWVDAIYFKNGVFPYSQITGYLEKNNIGFKTKSIDYIYKEKQNFFIKYNNGESKIFYYPENLRNAI